MSTSSREESPDWIRNFQTPTKSALLLSSDSEPSSADRQLSEDEKGIYEDDEVSLVDKVKVEGVKEKKRKRGSDGKGKGKKGDRNIAKQEKSETPVKKKERNHSIWTLSSDSESSPEVSPVRENNIYDEESMKQEIDQNLDTEKDNATVPEDKLKETPKRKSPKKRKTEDQIPTENNKQNSHVKGENDGNMEVLEEESTKPVGHYVSSSRLPLLLSEKVQRSKALVECEGDSIDLSGDVGAVGRVVISDDPTGNHDMFFDLKGTIYKTTIVPSRTFCVVSFGQSEAKIEAIMNDFIQLKPQSNVYEAETMVEGTLDGFSFDSEDEADNLPKAKTNQNEDVEEQQKGKGKGKGKAKAESKSVAGRKQGKSVGGKPLKKVKKKAQVAKKSKAKK